MKKIIFISIIFASALWSSCNESFLDQEKPLVSTDAIIYTDSTKTEMTLLGLYSSLKGTNCNFLGGRTYIAFDNRGDDIKNLDPNLTTLHNTYNMVVNSSDQENQDAWYYGYLAINRANIFMESLETYQTAQVIGDSLAKQYVAEAKFVRAIVYYYLVNLYSEPYKINKNAKAIPLRLNGIKENGHSNCPSSTIAKIYDQILKDLSDGEIQALPNNNNDVTRASRAAAYMLKMRVYMAMEDWSAAIKAGESVTGYTLVSDVAAQFKTPYYTEESIFSLPQTSSDRPNTQRSAYEYYNDGKICVIDKDYGIMSLPNYSLLNDKRVIAFDNKGKLAKYMSDDKLNWIPIFRYAETKLNLAECYAKDTKEGLARTELSEVRSRSINPLSDPLTVSALSGNDLLEAISNEKRLEFLGEGLRGIEIMRKGENFVKNEKLNVAQGTQGYTWPVPETERVNNSQWNELAQ